MRVFIAACLIAVAVTLALFVEPEARAETGTVLLVEAGCPCGIGSCTGHAEVASCHDTGFEDAEAGAVLKLPIETSGSESSAFIDNTASRKLDGRAVSIRRVLKLPQRGAGHVEDERSAASSERFPNVGVLA